MDRGVIATAEELFDARHYPSVVALATDALGHEPACVELLILRARAHIALRRDVDAQADLRDIIRHAPQRGIAYRLLGELAARRDENESAGIFFREAVRLDPSDREAREWLQIVDASARPSTRGSSLRTFVASRAPHAPARGEPSPRTLSSPARRAATEQVRFARGTQPPDEVDERSVRAARSSPDEESGSIERPTDRGVVSPAQIQRTTKPLARGSEPAWKTPEPVRVMPPRPPPPPPLPTTMAGRPPPLPPAKPVVAPPRPMARNLTPELPGFGDYLVSAGILTRERLRAAQAYQRSMKVQLATAIVTLGLATPQRIEWAAVSHQSELAQNRG